MYTLEYSTQFKKDFRKISKKPIPDVIEVGNIISRLLRGETLEAKYADHALTGNLDLAFGIVISKRICC